MSIPAFFFGRGIEILRSYLLVWTQPTHLDLPYKEEGGEEKRTVSTDKKRRIQNSSRVGILGVKLLVAHGCIALLLHGTRFFEW